MRRTRSSPRTRSCGESLQQGALQSLEERPQLGQDHLHLGGGDVKVGGEPKGVGAAVDHIDAPQPGQLFDAPGAHHRVALRVELTAEQQPRTFYRLNDVGKVGLQLPQKQAVGEHLDARGCAHFDEARV